MMKHGKWDFDANFHDDPFVERCVKNIGRISTRFEGFGVAKLMYGNCGKGKVEVYLNDVKKDWLETTDMQLKTFNFHFGPFDKLELREKDSAVIDLISLDVGPRGNLRSVKLRTF